MSLKDFKPDEADFDIQTTDLPRSDAGIETSGYQEEINTLKIDKLSNRVTIISIILPCLIGAILVFAYLDMKERVVDVDQTKNSQVERISNLFDGKLNALDIRIAKNRFDIDKQLPDIAAKQVALEGKMAKLNSEKADQKQISTSLSKIDKSVKKQSQERPQYHPLSHRKGSRRVD